MTYKQKIEGLLKPMRERCERAVPGPWETSTYANYTGYSIYAESFGCISERWSPGQDERIDWHATGKFIAHSRTDIEQLIAIVERQAEAIEALKDLRAHYAPNDLDYITAHNIFNRAQENTEALEQGLSEGEK